VAAQRSFIFLWCGNGDGLDKGRECLKKWGFRRCEDICWIKTNKKSPEHNRNIESGAIFQRTKVKYLTFFFTYSIKFQIILNEIKRSIV